MFIDHPLQREHLRELKPQSFRARDLHLPKDQMRAFEPKRPMKAVIKPYLILFIDRRTTQKHTNQEKKNQVGFYQLNAVKTKPSKKG